MKIPIHVLSNWKKHDGIKELTREKCVKVNCFFYDEDIFWFDYEGERFGLPYQEILCLRKKYIKKIK